MYYSIWERGTAGLKEYTNQILVTDKIFITPEFKRKKKAYKWYFIISVFLVVYLFSYYIYAEYDKNKSEEVSQTLLADINFDSQEDPPSTIKTKDNVIIVILEDTPQEVEKQININDLPNTDFDYEETSEIYVGNRGQDYSTVYTASDGTEYKTAGIIDIPKIDVHYPIIEPLDKNLADYTAVLKISPCRYYGPEPNEVGNYCIVGHNYRNTKFFSKVPDNIEIGDVVQITDAKGRMVTYRVYDRYIVNPDNKECTSQATNGKREVTIITCTNDSKQRVIVKCVEERYYNV